MAQLWVTGRPHTSVASHLPLKFAVCLCLQCEGERTQMWKKSQTNHISQPQAF